MASCWKALTRRKRLDTLSLEESKLARVLNTVDLTALGVGSTLGVGVYVLAGDVSKNLAGPAVVLSFLFAAVASLFAALCYAEFGARVPKAGSAYIYSYVCVGEFVAFIIGWNLILEYAIGSASVAKGLSLYLDSLLNNTMKEAFRTIAPMNISFMSPYFDFFSFSASMSLTVALALGVKESSFMNNILTTLNMGVVLFVIIAGSWKANPQNWKISKQDIPPGVKGGKGGFFPFGFVGALKGAATCFYGFVGFDCIATTGEEVKNPQKAIPVAIITSLVIIFFSYFGISTVLTMMWPYYKQDEDAPIPFVFKEVGWPIAQWIVAVGGIFGLCASLFGAMFPLPRIIYAMATDGLLFKFLGLVHPTFQTPLVGTLIAGTFTGLMSALFELEQLVNMMSIGTLIAYTIVAACVLLLRYKAELDEEGYSLLLTQLGDIADSSDNSEGELEEKTGSVYKDNPDDGSDIISSEYIESTNLVTLKEVNTFESVTKQLFNIRRLKCPTPLSSNIVAIQVFIFCVISTIANLCIVHFTSEIIAGHLVVTVITSLAFVFLCLILVSIARQPTSSKILSFKVPLVPLLPALSILININLMLMLDIHTWIRFGVWMIAGLVDYFFYGMWQSGVTHSKREGIKRTRLGHENKGFILDDKKPTSGQGNPKTSQGAMNLSQESNKSVTPPSPSEINKTNENKIDSKCKQEIMLNHNKDEVMRTSVYIGNNVDQNQYISSSHKFRNNTSVFGGDSIRSYVSVKNKSVGGGGNVVLSNAFDVLSSNVLTMSQNSEHFPIKVLSNNDVRSGQNQETVSEVSGHVSENVTSSKNTNNGVVNETEDDLYPNVIVIPHGDADEDSQGESCKIEGESEGVYEEDENCTAERSDDEQINNNETGPLNDTKDPNKVWRNYETQESELSGERSSQDSFHSAVDVIGEQPSEKMVDKLESETKDIDEINNYEESKFSKTKDSNEADATVQNNLNESDKTQSTLNIDKSPASLMLKGSFKTSSFAKRLDKLLQKTPLIGKSNSRHTLNIPASDISQQPGISKTLDLKRDKYATEKLDNKNNIAKPRDIKQELEIILSRRYTSTKPDDHQIYKSDVLNSDKSEVKNKFKEINSLSVNELNINSKISTNGQFPLAKTEKSQNLHFTNTDENLAGPEIQEYTEPQLKDTEDSQLGNKEAIRAKLEDLFSRKQNILNQNKQENLQGEYVSKDDKSENITELQNHKKLMGDVFNTLKLKKINKHLNSETSEIMNQYDQNENNSGSSTIDNFEVLKKQQIMGSLSSLKFVKKRRSEDESSSGSEDEVFVDTVDPKRNLETR